MHWKVKIAHFVYAKVRSTAFLDPTHSHISRKIEILSFGEAIYFIVFLHNALPLSSVCFLKQNFDFLQISQSLQSVFEAIFEEFFSH